MVDRAWYVAQAIGGLEPTAIYHLDREGVLGYSPVVDRQRLFPGYVFVMLERVEDSWIVNRTRGILKLLPKHAEKPLPVRNGFVEALRECVDRGDFSERRQEELVCKFLPYEVVTPLSGAYRDQRGRFLYYKKGCAVVLGHLLGKTFEFKVPLHQLRSEGRVEPPELRSTMGRVAA